MTVVRARCWWLYVLSQGAGYMFQAKVLAICFKPRCWLYVSSQGAGYMFQAKVLAICFKPRCWLYVSSQGARTTYPNWIFINLEIPNSLSTRTKIKLNS